MARISGDAQRSDPYGNFRFRVRWDGRRVAGVAKVGGLQRSPTVVDRPKGLETNAARKVPWRTKYAAITLERGVTHDREFEKWASRTWNSGDDAAREDARRDVVIEVCDESGRVAIAYRVSRCWVSEFQAAPALDADANAVAIEHLKLENEGWVRASTIVQPDEPPTA
jgi:phage tail-like protein